MNLTVASKSKENIFKKAVFIGLAQINLLIEFIIDRITQKIIIFW